jgi:hypothetical protein
VEQETNAGTGILPRITIENIVIRIFKLSQPLLYARHLYATRTITTN